MNNKELYLTFCKEQPKIPIFSQPWWLDAVCSDENWDVILIIRNNVIVASFPFYKSKKETIFGMNRIAMPILTQKLGPFIIYPPNQKIASKLSYEKEIFSEIINQIPKCDHLSINFDYYYTNWLPFYWNGFNQTTRYTYIIEDLSNPKLLFDNFSENKRGDIRKAQKLVTIKYDLSCEEFLTYYCNSLSKLNDSLNYSKELFRNIYESAHFRNQGKIIYAVGKENVEDIYGAIFYIWDAFSIYVLVTAFDPDFRTYAASSLLFYQIMVDNMNTGLKFDFEGSSIEKIENSYNKFGTKQVPFFVISKEYSRRFKVYSCLKELFK